MFVVSAVSQVLEAAARSLVMPGWAASCRSPGGQPNPVPEPGCGPGLAASRCPALTLRRPKFTALRPFGEKCLVWCFWFMV